MDNVRRVFYSFWAGRFADHFELLSNLIKDDFDVLRAELKQLSGDWKILSFNPELVPPHIPDVRREKEEVQNWVDRFPMQISKYLPLEDFQDLLNHMFEELEYVERIDLMTQDEETKFWFEESLEHFDMVCKLIPPLSREEVIERREIRQALLVAKAHYNVRELIYAMGLSEGKMLHLLDQVERGNLIGPDSPFIPDRTTKVPVILPLSILRKVIKHEMKESQFGREKLGL